MKPDDVRAALEAVVADLGWLTDALARVRADSSAVGRLFPAAGRHCGRGPLTPAPHGAAAADSALDGWTVDDAARALLLTAVPLRGAPLCAEVTALYRYGDPVEKRGVLRALPMLDIGDGGVPLLHDAIRSNDARLVAAALGPYSVRLDDPIWRQAVLKCVFMEIPMAVVHGLAERADATLTTMLTGLAAERRAAGRQMPADALALLDRAGVSGS